MSFTQTVSMNWREDGGSPLPASVALADSLSAKLDLVAAAGSYADAAFPVTLAKVSMLLVLSNADVTLQSGGVDEVQTLTPGGSIGGTDGFTLSFGGQTTTSLSLATATAAQVQSALQALSTIGAGNVLVTGAAGGPWTVTFVNALGRTNVAALTAVVSTTTGATLTIATLTAGVAPTESIAPKAGLPILWFVGCGMNKPFASDLATLRALNASGQQAAVKVRVLTHP
jgi:hypothetical protein